MKTMLRHGAMLLLLTAAAGCSTVETVSGNEKVSSNAKWVLLPIVNHTDTPQAGLSAEAIIEPLLRKRGIAMLDHYPAELNADSLFQPTERKVVDEAVKWADQQGASYGVTGAVEEWHYKVGIDGEPAVGVSLQVIDLKTHQVVWSAAGGKSGWSRQALSAVAQSLMSSMVSSIPLSDAASPAGSDK